MRTLWTYARSNIERTALIVAALVILMALFGGFLAPFDPLKIDFRSKILPPSPEHWLGTDGSGRDVLSRLLVGAQMTLASTAVVLVVVATFGCAVGIFSALVGGAVDNMLMRLADVWLGFPPLI
ncbi:MAG: D-ala-D-ala transporter subunit, partial [Ralstonia sp.]|nr:D-ala-D-ala transporter subunit [Ralstonia sp.]